MILLILSTAAGIGIALARGGTFASLLSARIRFPRVLAVAAGLGVFAEYVPIPGAAAFLIIALLLVLFGLSQNLHLTGVITVALGLGLNLLVLVANGHMPVRSEALIGAGSATRANVETAALGSIRELETADTRLAFLGDIVPVGLFNTVVSFGDLIAAAGLMIMAYRLLTKRAGVINLDDLFQEPAIDLREPQVRRTQPGRAASGRARYGMDARMHTSPAGGRSAASGSPTTPNPVAEGPSIRPRQAEVTPPPPGPNPRKIGGASPLPDRPR